MAQVSATNCLSMGNFYEQDFLLWCLFVHKTHVYIWLILRWLVSNGGASFIDGQCGQKMGTNIINQMSHVGLTQTNLSSLESTNKGKRSPIQSISTICVMIMCSASNMGKITDSLHNNILSISKPWYHYVPLIISFVNRYTAIIWTVISSWIIWCFSNSGRYQACTDHQRECQRTLIAQGTRQ